MTTFLANYWEGNPSGPWDLGGPAGPDALHLLVRLVDKWKDGEWRVENM